LVVSVTSDGEPVPQADVTVGAQTATTDAKGRVTLQVPAGGVTVVVTRYGFAPASAPATIRAGQESTIEIELEAEAVIEESVIVTATRTGRRIEDEPLRVEVVPAEEVQEKIMMTPGDVSMLLNETNGLRVQTTSPSLGGANVRIQGLRGRYTQILADGLPLYGGQTGSIGLLQIPPMDLGQVEVIKGVASALYGMSAIGGVVNLVSRRPPRDTSEREVLLNRTSHDGTDAILWLAQPLTERWGYTFVGGTHFQERSDLDDDGWTDLPTYRRFVARPRLFWDDGGGRSVLVALGAMTEQRRGGTMPGAGAPDGRPFAENLDTRRFDGGLVARLLTPTQQLLAIRASATAQDHDHVFGPLPESDAHRTWFGEVSMTGTNGPHTWVAGAALQRDTYKADEVPRFDYAYTVPGVFAQDEFSPAAWVTLSASGRLDAHSEYGTFLSPRVSALLRSSAPWKARVSVGRGYFAPTPFTEETEATGLTPLAPLGALESERADSVLADVTWAKAPLEVTATVFYSRIEGALQLRETGRTDFPIEIVNADGPTRTRGTELIARYHTGELDVIVTHMFLWSTEPDPDRNDRRAGLSGPSRREVPLNPRHSASFDALWEVGPLRFGFEVFYTGRQTLDDNPYRDRGAPYVLWGGLMDWRIGKARVFVNAENLSDVRQTRHEPLVRSTRAVDGRWTVDAWAPLEGRTVNAGIRFRF
jgi:iron complex outermembrane receptor protein